MKIHSYCFSAVIKIISKSVRFGSVRFVMLSVRFGSVQPFENFCRFRFGSVFKILTSVRFNFSKTQTDPITGRDLLNLFRFGKPVRNRKGSSSGYRFGNKPIFLECMGRLNRIHHVRSHEKNLI